MELASGTMERSSRDRAPPKEHAALFTKKGGVPGGEKQAMSGGKKGGKKGTKGDEVAKEDEEDP